MSVTAFTFVDTFTFATGSGSTTTLEFTADSDTSSDFKQYTGCQSIGAFSEIYVLEAQTASAGPIAFYVTQLNYDGLSQPWTVANPPIAGTVLLASGSLTNVSLSAVAVGSPTLALASVRSYAAFCGSGSTPLRPPGAPASPTPPAAGPTASPAPAPSGTPPAVSPLPTPSPVSPPPSPVSPPPSSSPAPLPWSSASLTGD